MRTDWERGFRLLAALVLTVPLLGACATAPSGGEPGAGDGGANDPAEPLNRGIFALNRGLDKMVLKPVATAYHDLLPPPVRTAVHNALDNLRSPIILIHDLLQGEGKRAGDTVARFFLNTTLGVAGLGDPATDWGFPFHDEDAGQTLAVWGVGEGPYVMLPVLGPSNPRDALGIAIDILADPVGIAASNMGYQVASYARTGATVVDGRAGKLQTLDDLEAKSLDFYSTLRSAYRQHRAWEIDNREGTELPPAPSLDIDLGDIDPGDEGLTDQVASAAPAEPEAPSEPEPAEPGPRFQPEALVPIALYDSYDVALAGWEAMAADRDPVLADAVPDFQEVATGFRTRILLLAALPAGDAEALAGDFDLLARATEALPAVTAPPPLAGMAVPFGYSPS